MSNIQEGTLLWQPSEKQIANTQIRKYMEWLEKEKHLTFQDYQSLWEWSTERVEDFWESIWKYFDIQSTGSYQKVLSNHTMPGAKWFDGAMVNYTEHIFRHCDMDKPAIIHASETRKTNEITWGELYQKTAAMQETLINIGLKQGDRVVAYVSNIYEAVVAFLAAASIGAIWSSASPEFGTQSVIDRFKQIEPKVMITVDGYPFGGKAFDRIPVIENIQKELPSLEATIMIPYLNQNPVCHQLKNVIMWDQAVATQKSEAKLTYQPVPFNDPLWVLFSSGTTGKPKPIVQSQGGILLEHLKALTFHVNLSEKTRFFWFTTTGWMMWNFLVGGLLTKSTIILYDGKPNYPDKNMLWQFAEETKMTVFGTSASFITSCMKDGIAPGETYDLHYLENISSTGSPLPPEGFKWCYDKVKQDIWIASSSGGTDVCTAFILGAPILPVYAGELQCRGLGAKIESYDMNASAQMNQVGELVLTEPFPSMPIYFWNDDDGSRMYDSYFNMFPDIWRHGDYIKITERNTCVIYGRSDATINRGGVRIGTSEIYRAVDQIAEITDSLIVDIPQGNGSSFVPLFVITKNHVELTDTLKQRIKQQIKKHCSPRHVPTAIYQVEAIPATLNGKKLEVPIKKILMGQPVDRVANKDSLTNPESLSYFSKFYNSINKK